MEAKTGKFIDEAIKRGVVSSEYDTHIATTGAAGFVHQMDVACRAPYLLVPSIEYAEILVNTELTKVLIVAVVFPYDSIGITTLPGIRHSF